MAKTKGRRERKTAKPTDLPARKLTRKAAAGVKGGALKPGYNVTNFALDATPKK